MPQLQPVPNVPRTRAGDVGGLVVAVDADSDQATVMCTGDLVGLTSEQCYMAAEMLLEAAEALRVARAAG